MSATEDATKCLNKTIDWENVQKKLDRFREMSYKWLVDALKDGGVI